MRPISASVGDQNGTSHWPLWEAARAAAVQPTRLGHPRFLDAVDAQTADFNGDRSPKMPAIIGLMWLNFLFVKFLKACCLPVRRRYPAVFGSHQSYVLQR